MVMSSEIEEPGESHATTPKTGSRANRHLYKVIPVRLPTDKWEQMRQEAGELGIGPTTLARIWILESLRRVNGNNHGNGGSTEQGRNPFG
jgi:hypothetical protein